MVQRKTLPLFDSAPKVNDPIFVLRIDFKTNMEEIYIGPRSYLLQYLEETEIYIDIKPFKRKRITSEKMYYEEAQRVREHRKTYHYHGLENEIIYKSQKKLGSLLIDFLNLPATDFQDSEYRKVFLDISPENYTQCILETNELFFSDNPVIKYFGLKIRNLYETYECYESENRFFPIKNILDSFSELVTKNPAELYMELCNTKSGKTLSPKWIKEFCTYYPNANDPVYSILTPGNKIGLMTDQSVTPLISQYVNIIASQKMKLRKCVICDSPFWVASGEKDTVCSISCRNARKKLERNKYNATATNAGWKQIHDNGRQYWINRINRLKKNGLLDVLDEVNIAYEKYKTDSLEWRDTFLEKTKLLTPDQKDYLDALSDLSQKHISTRDDIDNIFYKYGLKP